MRKPEIIHELVGISITEESLEKLFGELSVKPYKPEKRLWEIRFKKSPLLIIGFDEGNSWYLIKEVLIRLEIGEVEYETSSYTLY